MAEGLMPENLAGGRLEAVYLVAGFTYRQEETVNGDWGRDVGRAGRILPNDLGLGHIALAIRFDGLQFLLGPTRRREQQAGLLVEDRGDHEIGGGAFDKPKARAVLRVEARYGLVAIEDDLGTPGQQPGQGLAEAVGRIIKGILPEGMPIHAAQSDQEVALLALRGENDLVLVKDGGTGEAVVVLELARTHQPELFAA